MDKRKATVLRWFAVVGLIAAFIPVATCCGLGIVYQNGKHACPDRNRVRDGMTQDEVRSILGEPSQEGEHQDGVIWYYFCQSWLHSDGISVWFGKDGRVEHAFIND